MSISELKGLGPKSAASLATINIRTVEEFMATDAFQMYALLKAVSPETSLNMLYAMIGAQEGIHWQEVALTRKVEILMRLDDMNLAPKR